MKGRNLTLAIILLVNLIEIIIIKPLSPDFYSFTLLGKLIIIVGMYTFPIYVILPIGICVFIVLLPWIKTQNFRTKLLNAIRKTYFVANVIILLGSSILVYSQIALNNDLYPLVKYNSITGTQDNIDDIKVGTFNVKGGKIIRDEKSEIYVLDTARDTVFTDLKWISANEYELTARSKNNWLKDNTTRVKITSNKPDYYECYTKSGDYAIYYKIKK